MTEQGLCGMSGLFKSDAGCAPACRVSMGNCCVGCYEHKPIQQLATILGLVGAGFSAAYGPAGLTTTISGFATCCGCAVWVPNRTWNALEDEELARADDSSGHSCGQGQRTGPDSPPGDAWVEPPPPPPSIILSIKHYNVR